MKPFVWHVLDREPCGDLATYRTRGGGHGLDVARRVEPEAIIDEIEAAGLRGRGGAGFPTAVKWRTVRESTSEREPTPVVVNAAEGEPGTFKDRALLRTNPYKVIEGALIAAIAVGADRVTIATKASFTIELERVRGAIAEVEAAGWNGDISIDVAEGPSSYLYGEETGLLEVLDGRQPFPRVTPPFRRGLHDPSDGHLGDGRSAVAAELAGVDLGAPVLVDNVETLANVPFIVHRGGQAFREYGTERSSGTIICTVTGDTLRHGVGEVPLGTTVREVVDGLGGGLDEGRSILGVLSGVSGPLIPAELLDTPLTYEDMAAAGLGLGSASLIVFDDRRDPVAIAQAAARFLSVESCGQCEPCKRDGLAISAALEQLAAGVHGPTTLDTVRDRLRTVADGARCNLGRQTQDVVGSVLRFFEGAFAAHQAGTAAPAELLVIAPVVDIVDDRALLDSAQATKQPDWTHDAEDSLQWPAARLGNTPVAVGPEGASAERAGRPSEPDAEGDPLAVLGVVHDRLTDLLDQVRAHPDDDGLREALADSLAVHCDVVGKIVVPMVRRVGGSAGDDLAWAADGHDQSLLATAALLRRGGRSADELDGLAADLARHVEIESSMADLLRRNLDRTGLDDLAEAMDESRQTSLDG